MYKLSKVLLHELKALFIDELIGKNRYRRYTVLSYMILSRAYFWKDSKSFEECDFLQ